MDPINWTKLPSLTSLRAFEAVAETGNFSAAARRLNVTHAAVAQQVKALEDHLGLSLVHRSPRGVTLNESGRALAQSLRDGFLTIAAGIESLLEKEQSRPIRVTTTAFFAETNIFPRIAQFWQDNPDIEISFSPSDAPVDIIGEGFDVAIRAGGGAWPGLHARLLLESPTRAYAAPALVDDPDTDWAGVPWLVPNDSFWEREALSASGIDPASVRTIDVGNPALEIRAAQEGLGLLVEAEADVRAHIRNGSLKVAPIPLDHVSRFFVVTPPWRPRPSVQLFIDWLMETCSQPPGI